MTVVRNGKEVEIDYYDVRVGDVLKIQSDIIVPFDAVLLEGQSVTIDESTMIGETNPVTKQSLEVCMDLFKNGGMQESEYDYPSPIILARTSVLSGEGYGVIVRVRANHFYTVESLETFDGPKFTSLQYNVRKTMQNIRLIWTCAAVFVFALLFVRFSIENGLSFSSGIINIEIYSKEWIRTILVVLIVITTAIPQSLGNVIVTSICAAIKNLQKENVIVRRISSLEILAQIDAMC